jgi:hypothetical protein
MEAEQVFNEINVIEHLYFKQLIIKSLSLTFLLFYYTIHCTCPLLHIPAALSFKLKSEHFISASPEREKLKYALLSHRRKQGTSTLPT